MGSFMLDLHTSAANGNLGGYTEHNPPLLVKDHAAYGTGNLPKFAEDLFRTTKCRLRRMQKAIRCNLQAKFESQAGAVESSLMRSKIEQIQSDAARTVLAHPDRRSVADQPRARTNPRRSATPHAHDGMDAVFPLGSGGGRQRYARHDPPAPVLESRTRLDHDARGQVSPSTSA